MILNSWKVIIAAMESRLKVKNSEVVKEKKIPQNFRKGIKS